MPNEFELNKQIDAVKKFIEEEYDRGFKEGEHAAYVERQMFERRHRFIMETFRNAK